MERCIVFQVGDEVTVGDLPEDVHECASGSSLTGISPAATYHEAVADAKRAILRSALDAEGAHQTRAAKRLGLTQPYLARLIKNLRVR